MAQVSLQNVRKVYAGGVEAVRDLTLDVPGGELTVLVGPSGCGKSTVLRLIAGLENPSQGTIRISGRDMASVPPSERGVALVSQSAALYPHLRGAENLAFPLRVRGVPTAEVRRRVDGVALALGLGGLLDRRPPSLSGGERRRFALGRALVQEPRVLLLDEPLASLDAGLRGAVRREIKSRHTRLGTTMLYVTHDQEEAMALAQRLIVMSRGLVQQAAPPLEVYHRPANRFVASFFGSPPMNFLPCAMLPPQLSGGREGAIAGIRPGGLREKPGGGGPLALRVAMTEMLGDVMDVHGMVGTSPLVARLPAREGVSPGDVLPLEPDPGAVLFFEPGEFGRRLA